MILVEEGRVSSSPATNNKLPDSCDLFFNSPLMKSIHFNVQLDATTLITPGISSKLKFKLIVVHYWTSLINRVHFGTTLFSF